MLDHNVRAQSQTANESLHHCEFGGMPLLLPRKISISHLESSYNISRVECLLANRKTIGSTSATVLVLEHVMDE